MPPSLLLACALALTAQQNPAATQPARTDAELRTAFERLDPAQRTEFAEWLRLECTSRDTFQAGLMQFVLARQDRDRSAWPLATAPAWFDPQVHAPAQPIARRWLAADDPRARKARQRILGRSGTRRLDAAWHYDYASGEVHHDGRANDPERLFANALAGFAPDADLVEALVERELDCVLDEHGVPAAAPGTAESFGLRAAFAAFGHAYTDRAGNAYPGITLLDALSSGAEVEMPDVDTLGLVHTLLDEWRRWVAPVSDRDHAALYEEVGRLVGPVHRHRLLRRALARTYLCAEPVIGGGYEGAYDRFHLLWEESASTPEVLRALLPAPADVQAFLAAAARRLERREAVERSTARRNALSADAARVRSLVEHVLAGLGALPSAGSETR